MSITLLLGALESVPRHFSVAARSKQEAVQALATARRLHQATQAATNTNLSDSWHTLERWVCSLVHSFFKVESDRCAGVLEVIASHPLTCSPVCRPVAAAAHSLSLLAAAATPALAQPYGAPAWLQCQIDTGFSALESLALIASRAAQPTAHLTKQMEAACSLVVGPGRARVQTLLAAVQAGSEDAGNLLKACYSKLNYMLCMARGLTDPEHQQQAAAEFASSTAQPAVLLPWLASLSQAITVAGASGAPGEPPA